jgi:tetratricopeptide (TPR) repeat protein
MPPANENPSTSATDNASKNATRLRRRWASGIGVAILLAVGSIVSIKSSRVSLPSVEAALQKGDLPAATSLVDHYVRETPEDVRGWMLKATIAERTGSLRDTAAAYSRASGLRPTDLSLLHRCAKSLMKTAQFQSAEVVFRNALNVSSNDESAQTELQWMLFHQQRDRELEEFLEACLRKEPNSPRLLFHLVMTSQKPPNPLESLPVLEKIDADCPGQSSIELGIARCAWRMGDIPRARKLFDKVIKTAGISNELALTLAEFEFEQTNLKAAEDYLTSVSDGSGSSVDDRWWWLTGQIAQHRRKYEDALHAYTTAAGLRPRELRYLHSRATLLQIVGRTQEATELQTQVEARRVAERQLYLIVNGGGLGDGSAVVCKDISRIQRILGKNLQAEGWALLGRIRSSQ